MFNIITSFVTFFLFSFYSILLPMDQPIKKHWKDIDTAQAFDQLQMTGGCWGMLSSDHLKIVFPKLTPQEKNTLIKTNKAFNILLSRENPQSFMFCNRLSITWSDRLALCAQKICLIDHQVNNAFSLEAIQKLNTFFNEKDRNFGSYSIIDELSEYRFITCQEGRLIVSTATGIAKNLHPFIIPWCSRNPLIITKYLKNLVIESLVPQISFDDIKLLLSILIKNDDAHSLEIFRSTALYKEFNKNIKENVDLWLQLAVFCASPKIINNLVSIRHAAMRDKASSGTCIKEKNYFPCLMSMHLNPQAMSLYKQSSEAEKSHRNDYCDIVSIVNKWHAILSVQHCNHLERYYNCLRQFLKDKYLQKLGVLLKSPIEKPAKKEKKSNFSFSLKKKK